MALSRQNRVGEGIPHRGSSMSKDRVIKQQGTYFSKSLRYKGIWYYEPEKVGRSQCQYYKG